MKNIFLVLITLALNSVSIFAQAKEERKPASECSFGNVQEEIYIVFHDANRHIIHTSLTPEDQVTFGSLGVNADLASRLAFKINQICGRNKVTASDFHDDVTLLAIYKKLNVYNP